MSDPRTADLAVVQQMLPNAVGEHPLLAGDGFESELYAQALECIYGRV